MPDYKDHQKTLLLLKKAQEADEDSRELAREAREFLMPTPQAQWDEQWWAAVGSDRPRYTFDITTPIVDLIAGSMERANFGIDVKPAGGDASKELANHLDGLIRNNEVMANALDTYNRSSRLMVIGGLDGWELVQDYSSPDSFDQDVLVKPVHNWIDRVWLDHASEEQDGSDCRHGFKLTGVATDVFEEKWGTDRVGQSLDQAKKYTATTANKEVIVCGQLYYLQETKRNMVLMTNGATYDADSPEYKAVADDLAAQGITVKSTRTRPEVRQWVRWFDGNDWLGEAQETVFDGISLIPMYGNFEVYENQVMYRGEVAKLMDPQKVFNYAASREVEEGALAPRAKIWMTKGQVGGDEDIATGLQTLNTNKDPVQFWDNANPEDPAPFQMGGAQINPGLTNLSASMKDVILGISGHFAAAQGDNPGLQSGVAIEKLQDKTNTGTVKYFTAREIAQTRTAQLAVRAIPRLYDGARQVRTLGEDGSYEMVTLNQPILDQATGQMREPIDFSKGVYDVSCTSGESFKSKQEQTRAALQELGTIVPGAVEMNADIVLSNTDAPGMSEAAERMRQQLINSGAIPEDQLSEEEIMALQKKAQQQQEPDALMVAAMAEQAKADAAMQDVQVKTALAQARLQEQELKIQQAQHKLEVEQFKAMMEQQKFEHQRQMDMVKAQKTIAETEGQEIDNALSLEQLREMPMDKLLERQQMVRYERQVN